MILVLTNSDDATADYLCSRLYDQRVEFLRFDTDRDLTSVRLSYNKSSVRLLLDGATYPSDVFSNVWFRRPEPLRRPAGAEAGDAWQIAYEWSEAIEGFLSHIPIERWINHPSRNALASRKMEQLTRARSYGLNVPETIVTQDPAELANLWNTSDGKIIVKPLGCGYIEREAPESDTQIYTNRVSPAELEHLGDLSACPTLFQQAVDKNVDVRITIIDGTVSAVTLSAKECGQQRTDIRRDNMRDVEYTAISLPTDLQHSLTSLISSYGLRFAAVDMAIDKNGKWWFFEINPNGQWAWLDLAGASDIAGAFLYAFARPTPT